MKVTLIIRQPEISRIFPNGLQFSLEDACIIDVVKAADEEIKKRCGRFPVEGFKSLFQMVFHPVEERFYKHVALQAFTKSQPFLSMREKPKMKLPSDVTLILVPEGGCVTEWEEVVDT